MFDVTKTYILFVKDQMLVKKSVKAVRFPEKKDVVTYKDAEVLIFGMNLIYIVRDEKTRTETYRLENANLLLTVLDRFLGHHITKPLDFSMDGL